MQVSAASMLAFWLSIFLLITTGHGTSPSLMPRRGFTINTVRNNKHVPNGVAAKAKAMGKFAHLVKSDNVKTLNNYNASGLLQGFVEQDDREWLCPVSIGTPPQTVNLDLDTGSADLWVFTPDSGQKKGELGSRAVYDPGNSSTSQVVNGSSWSISYGDGSYASGSVYTDTVGIAGLNVYNATVEVATSFSTNLVRDDAPLSGLMGLAINLTTTTSPTMPPILPQLFSQGIHHIGVDLQYHSNGTLHFGSVDHTAYTGPLKYQAIKPNKGYWWIDLTTMRVGDAATTANNNTNKTTMVHSWDTIVDTGTSLFLAPTDIVAAYYRAVPSAKLSPQDDDAYVFHCNESLPDFHFGFADNWSDFRVPGAFMNYSLAPVAGFPWCYGGIQASNMGFSIMGDVFLKAVYVDFNMANQSVGFARKMLNF